MDLVLIKLVDMSFNGMFSDPHCMYTGLQVDLFLIKLVDMSIKGMFSDLHSMYTDRPIGGSGFNQVGGHEYQGDVFRSSLHVYRQTYRWIWF